MRHAAAAILLALAATPAAARQVKIIEPMTVPATEPKRIVGMDLAFAPAIEKELAESDAKAAGKRAAKGLPPLDPASYPQGDQPESLYETLPMRQMFPLVLRDTTKAWGLDAGRPVRLRITLDRLQTANLALAWLAGSSDILAGEVQVLDAESQAPLGRFRIDVVNTQSGLAGMAIRGGGVREKLAEEFGLELSRELSGRKRKAG